ncbi:unnamed protein product [Trichogramma brassicae]|uniref:Integrase catalytic domain-containing protein n=1 Tax=Trichogramma brassicae TaxID=86971 RepID=A0A6H5IVA6_9HYME|nr:unnamed protein product [Trichogramma brassicae]
MEPTVGRRRGSLSRRLPTYTSRESRSGVVRLDLLYILGYRSDDRERENRFFVDVRVGPFTYKALLDSGAQCCLAGPRMMRELAERIKPSMSLIGYANQQTQPSGGYLPVMLQIDREAGRIDMECTEILPVEMVLGVDFGRRWRVDISMGRNQWRSGDGPWHNFAKLNEARSMRCDIVAECAGITVCGGEREIIESKIKRLIPDVPPKLGHTDKIVHRIEFGGGRQARHLGAKKTYDRLACEYWWPGMWYAVEEYCNSCDVCQRYKVPQTGPKGLMTRRVVDRPWAVVAADMMEFPRSKNQNKYLLVFQDLFTRWIEIVPLRKANGVNVLLRAFEELVLFRWETPEFLLTDNGKEFDNAVMERNTNEEQRRSFAAVVRGATGRTAPSVRPAMDERAGGRRAPRETPARRQEPAKRRWLS